MKKLILSPVTLENWKKVPVFHGRLATKADVDAGRAMFCTIEAGGEMCELDLPFCAIYTEEKTGERLPVIVVQAEKAHNVIIVGARTVDGNTMVCTFRELQIVNNPDQKFFSFNTANLDEDKSRNRA